MPNDEFDIDTARSFKDQNSFVPLPLHQRLLEPVIMRRGVAGPKSLRVLPQKAQSHNAADRWAEAEPNFVKGVGDNMHWVIAARHERHLDRVAVGIVAGRRKFCRWDACGILEVLTPTSQLGPSRRIGNSHCDCSSGAHS